MKKFPIVFGKIDKKLYLVLLLALTMILANILMNLIPKGNYISTINGMGGAFSQMLGILVPYIFKYKGNSPTSTRKCTKINFKHYSIFFLIVIFHVGTNILIDILSDKLNKKEVPITKLEICLCFMMIFYIVLSIIILKSKYYIHNIISMILFCIFTIIIDHIFGYLNYLELYSFIYLIPLFFESLLNCYIKYMIDKKYHSYWNILFFIGLYYFIFYSIEFIVEIIEDPNDNPIFKKIRNAETKYIILSFFIDIIFSYYLRLLLIMSILDFFSLNHVLLSDILKSIIIYAIEFFSNYDKYKNYLLFLIPAFFQILSLLFFIEILEFNFCNLNKNTKRNIMLREEEDEMLLKNSTFGSNIEIDKGLILDLSQDKKNIELNELMNNNDADEN